MNELCFFFTANIDFFALFFCLFTFLNSSRVRMKDDGFRAYVVSFASSAYGFRLF